MIEQNLNQSDNLNKNEEFCLTKQAIINHYFSGIPVYNINKASLNISFKDSTFLKLLPFTKSLYRSYYLTIKNEGKVSKVKITFEEKEILKALITQ